MTRCDDNEDLTSDLSLAVGSCGGEIKHLLRRLDRGRPLLHRHIRRILLLVGLPKVLCCTCACRRMYNNGPTFLPLVLSVPLAVGTRQLSCIYLTRYLGSISLSFSRHQRIFSFLSLSHLPRTRWLAVSKKPLLDFFRLPLTTAMLTAAHISDETEI